METRLVAVLFNVVGPANLTGLTIECVKVSRARANKEKIAHDRGRREHSTVRIELPKNRGVLSLSGSLLMLILVRAFTAAGNRKAHHQGYSDEIDFHVCLESA